MSIVENRASSGTAIGSAGSSPSSETAIGSAGRAPSSETTIAAGIAESDEVGRGWGGWPGSKGGSGVAERIIGEMPVHRNYVEGFLGFGAVMRRKVAAPELNVGIDVAAAIMAKWSEVAGVTMVQADAVEWLSSNPLVRDPGTLVYLDPPYLASVRTRLFYEHEFETCEQHERLLSVVRVLPCMVMISGYWSSLYASMLDREGWRAISYRCMTRGGARDEWLWMNFPAGRRLHDVRYAGVGFRERERIKRRRERWIRRLEGMGERERQVIQEALLSIAYRQK